MSQSDASLVKPFVDGAQNALKTLCNLSATPGKPFIKKERPNLDIGIAGVVGLTSSGLVGSVTISFPEGSFLQMMGRMLGETFNCVTPEIEDGAAELMNIIFGHAKRELNQRGHDLEKAIPTIIRGKTLQVFNPSKVNVVVLPFVTEVGEFFMEVAIEKRRSRV